MNRTSIHKKHKKQWRIKVLALALPLGALGVAIAAPAVTSKLIMNGKVASTDVRVINGSTYVKLADIAKALGMAVVKRADGSYELKKPGGAQPIKGVLQGKVGDVLFDGKWRFQVLEADVVESYTMKHVATVDYSVYATIADYDPPTRTFRPGEGRSLVVLKCRLTNGQNSQQSLWYYSNDTHTALTDMKGESHPPIAHDIEESAPLQSKALLPGAKLDFAVLFSVPQDIRAKDLVFTLRTISDKGNDVRVSLTEPED